MTDSLLATDEQLTGEVVGVRYADPDSGFGVIELEPEDGGDGARCSGPLASVVEGQTITVVGRWNDHPTYGTTFEAILYEQATPTTVAGLRSFLASERFADVPTKSITRVLTTFGRQAGQVIEHEPDRLAEGAGIPSEDAQQLHRAWCEGLSLAELVRLVEPCKWPMDVVRAVHARFGADAPDVARRDPYALLAADRVRFAQVDRLATQLGIEPTDQRRLAAGARAAVASARRSDGHQHLLRDVCATAAQQVLGVDRVLADDGVAAAIADGSLEEEFVDGEPVISTPEALQVERDLAAGIVRLFSAERSRLTPFAADLDPSSELTDGQAQAVRRAFEHPVSVLTGGPGTGKTRTVQEVVRAAEDAGLEVALCAPTGRAAKRIEELVGRPAMTIHRLLEARPTGGGGFAFRYGRFEQVPFDLVVVDEVSMCDTALAERLISAVEDGGHLLLVGDPDQLPSVGPGDVLRDIVRCGVVPVTALTEIHRQAAGSRIVSLAREVLTGEIGSLRGVDGDVFLAEERDRNAITPRVVQAVAERAPSYFEVSPDDVQVLAPMYRGPAGVDALNAGLKRALNPADGQPAVAGFNRGDRVMQTRNDAVLEVANGDVGRVVDLSTSEVTLRIAFPRGEVTYGRKQARDLAPAWAVTVHKSQGGEWPVIVLVCDRSHRVMLWRNLLYTAITRAQRALIVVGQAEALRIAARHDRPSDRRTGLAWRLQQAMSAG